MNESQYATEAQALITIIAALIPLLIWAFRDAEPRLEEARMRLLRRFERG